MFFFFFFNSMIDWTIHPFLLTRGWVKSKDTCFEAIWNFVKHLKWTYNYWMMWKPWLLHTLYTNDIKIQKQKTKLPKRRYWVHPINLRRPQEGQFNVNFMILRAHPEKFQMYYRMSIQLLRTALQGSKSCCTFTIKYSQFKYESIVLY